MLPCSACSAISAILRLPLLCSAGSATATPLLLLLAAMLRPLAVCRGAAGPLCTVKVLPQHSHDVAVPRLLRQVDGQVASCIWELLGPVVQ